MSDTKATEEAARTALSRLIELSGLSRREIERRLLEQQAGTDLGRLLSGRLDLKLRHIVDIVRVIELHPHEFFRLLFKEAPDRSPLLRRLDGLMGALGPMASPPPEVQRILKALCSVDRELQTVKRQLVDLAGESARRPLRTAVG
jgi:hypothetical protein